MTMDELLSTAGIALASNRFAGARDMSKVIDALSALERGLRRAQADGSLDEIVSRSTQRLQDVLGEVEILLKEPNVRADNGALIGFRDRVFKGLLPDIRNVKQTQHVTNVFNAFVRGITYFASEGALSAPHHPAYHRHGSCPPRGRDNPRCLPENSSNVRKVKKSCIEKCYIERSIYDLLWTRFVGSQDEGHLLWLLNTKQAYSSCYPDLDLIVRVDFDAENNLPVGVRIAAHRTTDGVVAWSAHYKKYVGMYDAGIYTDNVQCIKQDADGRVYAKVASFHSDVEWSPQ